MKRIKHFPWVFFICYVFCLWGLFSRSYSQDRKDLERIKNEIQELERELKTKEQKEITLLEQVEDIDRQIGLQKKLLSGLEDEKRKKLSGIRETETHLKKASEGYLKMKDMVRRRIVTMYKRGRIADLEIFLSMNSLNQALVWLKYQKKIIDNDRRNLRVLQDKKAEFEKQNRRLQNELQDKERLLSEERRGKVTLEEKKTSREKLIVQIREDKESIREGLEEKRKTYDHILGWIRREEAKRREVKVPIVGETGFASLKGRMVWPVRGRVVTPYGRQKHPVLKTWTENLGIDIKTQEREKVQAVCNGAVKWVTWQRGMGNLVLLDHGSGYYTVYGYLEEVWVLTGDNIEERQIIGRVGDLQSLNGSNLHFQVWNGTEHYDPKIWMKK